MNMIFHVPFKIDKNRPSGTNIRPMKMLNSFKNSGYNVDVVMGTGKERKQKIKKIKKKIKTGVKYDFLYSESSTLPTLLTEKHHFPCYPFLDFGFFKFCKKNNIKIGLFYRDIYWNLKEYKNNVSLFKRIITTIFYKYDLFRYNQLVDVLYLPSLQMYDYIPFEFDNMVKSLPPGIDSSNIKHKVKGNKKKNCLLNIFYVGGLGHHYNFEKLLKVVNKLDYVSLTICCRKKDWKQVKNKYKNYLTDSIEIVHKSGNELIPYFKEADLSNLFFKPEPFRKFAMPIKLFEYLEFKTPILATNGTAAGNFVENNDIGWVIEYSIEELVNILEYIKNNKLDINEKKKNMNMILKYNTWKSRAENVINDLIY